MFNSNLKNPRNVKNSMDHKRMNSCCILGVEKTKPAQRTIQTINFWGATVVATIVHTLIRTDNCRSETLCGHPRLIDSKACPFFRGRLMMRRAKFGWFRSWKSNLCTFDSVYGKCKTNLKTYFKFLKIAWGSS